MAISTINIPWNVIVQRADPNRLRDLTREPEYEFKRKTFRGDGRRRGVYTPRAPSFAVNPSLMGAAIVGNVLEVDPGGRIGAPDPTITYQWYADGAPMPASDDLKILLIEADAGSSVVCRVTLTNASGSAYADTPALTVASRPE